MQSLLFFLVVMALTTGTVDAALSTPDYHVISVDAGVITGTLKNLQGTNNAKVRTLLNPHGLVCSIHPNNRFLTFLFRNKALSNDETDIIDDATAAVQAHWANSSVKHVMICEIIIPNGHVRCNMLIVEMLADTFPDVFTGDYTDGDSYDSANYDFTKVRTCDTRKNIRK